MFVFLKMAAWAQSPGTNCASRNDENDVEFQFIDEDELPLACISVLEHPESEEEIGSDDLAESSGDESEESESEEDEDVEEEEQWAWREEINRRNDVDFNEFVGLLADMNLRSLTSSKGLFDLFFTDQVWELIVTQTNLYANQKRGAAEKSVWYPVSVAEMKGWVAVYLCMGIVSKPNILSYWSTDLSTPFFGATMSRTRFLQILRYLHFVDNSQGPKPHYTNINKLYKIQPLLDLIIPRFRAVYKPERQLAVDETLIKFKGKIHFRQFIPIKPGRFGIKAFTLAESTSGYVLGSKVYTGKEANVVQKDLGKRAVMLLMEPFLDKGYYV